MLNLNVEINENSLLIVFTMRTILAESLQNYSSIVSISIFLYGYSVVSDFQAEACEAGLEPRVLQTWLTEVDARSEDALTDLLHKEVNKWSHNCVDVEELQKRLARAEETCAVLGNKVALLQGQLDNYRMEKRNDYSTGERKSKSSSSKNADDITVIHRGVSSNAEDEGISSSERSSSPSDDGRANGPSESKIGSIDNDQETTIDDVIEELRIIVKDAEEEFEVGMSHDGSIF